MALDTLTHHDVAILALEAQFWKTADGKEAPIRDEIGMTPVRYYRRLNQLVDGEATLAHDPMTINRLRRIRSRRTANRRCALS
jgi:hypothetical protein